VKYRVYGFGHLADTLRAELDSRAGLAGEGDRFDLAFVAQDVTDHRDALQLEEVARCFGRAASTHPYVVVLSQVPPGWMREAVALADNRSGVFYQVDTIIVKRAVARMLCPEQFIIGCVNPEAPLPLEYQQYLAAHDCPVLQMSYESAEMAKCGINYMLAEQVRVARDLYAACLKTGADYDDVRRAMHNDARIGPVAYLRPGQTNRHLDRDVETINDIIGREG
jgi:UDPglucose 6-dehydrogenase